MNLQRVFTCRTGERESHNSCLGLLFCHQNHLPRTHRIDIFALLEYYAEYVYNWIQTFRNKLENWTDRLSRNVGK